MVFPYLLHLFCCFFFFSLELSVLIVQLNLSFRQLRPQKLNSRCLIELQALNLFVMLLVSEFKFLFKTFQRLLPFIQFTPQQVESRFILMF
jgi:hypothetical protein